jgi:hypothetical protein
MIDPECTNSAGFWMNQINRDAMNDGPYRMNQDALPISFVKVHYRAERAFAASMPIA